VAVTFCLRTWQFLAVHDLALAVALWQDGYRPITKTLKLGSNFKGKGGCAMAEDTQKILDEILDNLKSSDSARKVEGIHALEQVNYSSKLIFFELERLAIH